MLQLMRKKAQSWMIKVIFAVIIIVFVFFYGYGRRTGKGRVVAEVNGTKIGQSLFRTEYQKAYQNVARLYQSIYKDKFHDGMIDRFGLGVRILNGLIDQTLIRQEAERLSLDVTSDELQAAVRSNPAFQVDGTFDEQRFRAVLQMNQMSAEEFQETEKRNRLVTKLTNLISLGGVELSDQEVLDAYTLENERINLCSVRFVATDYEESISTDDSEVEAYYSENTALFEMPPRVQVQYVVFAPDDFLDRVEISPEEVREEYEVRLDEYLVPKRVKVSHILMTPGEESTEEGMDDTKRRAEDILEKAKKGEDFAALAEAYSKDPDTAKNGGSIGWITDGEDAPEFTSVAFSLEKGEIGPLIESEDGFHIIKAEDVEEERVRSLEEVENEIRDELAKAKSRQLAEEEAEQAFFAIFETKDLKAYATEKGMSLETTDFFSRDERLGAVGGNLEFNNTAFSLEEGEIPEEGPLKIGGKDYLIKVIKREDSKIPPFEEVTEKVRAVVLREKATDKAKAAAEEMLEEAKKTESLVQSAQARGMEVEETGLFQRRSGYIPKVGSIQDLGKEIFSLSPEDPLLEKVVPSGNVFFVMELKDKESMDMEKFESEKEAYRGKLYAEKRSQILEAWLDSLRKKSDIKIREENLSL